ncbi:hypothetical protein M9Y10_014055 [Tritrichomonas musculus]|uniref:Uncharacterized protein n=1 Tax=Tritrichomonas musculus TaxID=1915356 RepID=A0ABR2KZL9_9EUKA
MNSQVRSIEFASDSQIQTIERNSFALSPLESLNLPSSVTDLKPGWCSYTSN